MKILKAYKTELDPNNKQRTLLNQYAGTARFVFNWALADRQFRYKDGLRTTCYGQRGRFNALKINECPWVVSMPYAITESAFANCDTAFKNFFRRVKKGEKPGFPKFKTRRSKKSFQLKSTRIEIDRVRLTHLGWIRLKERNYIPTRDNGTKYCTYATMSEKAGRWYISVLVEEDIDIPLNDSTLIIGIDFGLKTLAVLSNGETFENPRCLIKAQKKLAKLNRELGRRVRGSANWNKTKVKLQRQYAKVTNIRKHALHNISHHVTSVLMPKLIVVEDLNVSGMMKNRHLSKAISDVGFGELRRQIEYKAKWCGIEVIVADRWFASSKTCSGCGYKLNILKLSDRTFVCPECGLKIDRDLNAALNLEKLAA